MMGTIRIVTDNRSRESKNDNTFLITVLRDYKTAQLLGSGRVDSWNIIYYTGF
jgi:hypothetical protein